MDGLASRLVVRELGTRSTRCNGREDSSVEMINFKTI